MSSFFRQIDARRLEQALYSIPLMPGLPRLYQDRNGRGQRYFSIKSQREDGGLCALYLGRLSPASKRGIEHVLAACSPPLVSRAQGPLLDHPRIRQLRRWRQQSRQLANTIGAAYGWRLKGYQLVHSKRMAATERIQDMTNGPAPMDCAYSARREPHKNADVAHLVDSPPVEAEAAFRRVLDDIARSGTGDPIGTLIELLALIQGMNIELIKCYFPPLLQKAKTSASTFDPGYPPLNMTKEEIRAVVAFANLQNAVVRIGLAQAKLKAHGQRRKRTHRSLAVVENSPL